MDKKLNKNVTKVYTVITGGLYPDPDTDSSGFLTSSTSFMAFLRSLPATCATSLMKSLTNATALKIARTLWKLTSTTCGRNYDNLSYK